MKTLLDSVASGFKMRRSFAGLCGVMALAVGSVASGQTPPSAGSVLAPLKPKEELRLPAGHAIVLPTRKLHKSGSRILISVRHLVVEGNTLLPRAQLASLLAPAEGKTLTLDELNGYVARITAAYKAAGYPIAYAYLPAQTVRAGKIRVAVIEPHYDAVTTTGTSRFKATSAKRTVGVKAGEMVSDGPLDRGLLLLSQTPGLKIQGILRPGSAPGTTTLELKRTDLPLTSGSFSLNNHGNIYTGSILAKTALSVNDPFGYGSSFSGSILSSDTGHLKAGGLSALSPDLNNGLRVGVYGSYSDYHLGGTFASLNLVGKAQQVGVDLTYPIILEAKRVLNFRMDVVKNWLTQNTRSTGLVVNQRVDLARFSLSGAVTSRTGATTSGSLALAFGGLRLTPLAARNADAAGPKAAGGFQTLRFQLGRTQAIGQKFSLSTNLAGQWSNRNLDSSQKFYLGGPDGVMSAAVGDGGGDEGLILHLRLSRALKAAKLPGKLTGSVISQFGAIRVNHTPYAGGANPNFGTAGAAGLELKYSQKDWTITAAYVAPAGGNGIKTGAHLWLKTSLKF